MNIENKVRALQGPILVLGASGFIGINILRKCLEQREDVVGTYFSGDSWRLAGITTTNIIFLNLEDPVSIRSVLQRVRPKTIFDCSSFGAYSFEQDVHRIHATNYLGLLRIMEYAADLELSAYIHAGSSSEYGLNSAAPTESAHLVPNSDYAVSKAAASHAISYYGKVRGFPVANLRLYSIYGPYEDSSRLIPVLCEHTLRGVLPPFAHPDVSRDFLHVDDAVAAFVDAALALTPENYGESFNIGSGVQTTLSSLAALTRELFQISDSPEYTTAAGRRWDLLSWHSDPARALAVLNWSPEISLRDGLLKTREWWKTYLDTADFSKLTKKKAVQSEKNSVSAIVACYRDEPAIAIMHQRLVAVFQQLDIDYEIIFVNDNSPDNSTEVIREISARDPNVFGILHTRNFGSQAAFRSGMELASKEACVLLDGDLQDPPELIAEFVGKWRDGADVVYGHRIKREMPRLLEACYRMFYFLFAAMSDVPIPKDAGDFSLMDRTVVYWILQCQERDAFLRGLRAFVGFKQVGVDYERPERMFGRSTNNWIKNIGWAKKGIFSFSRMPLHLLTALGALTCFGTVLMATFSILVRLLAPEMVPKGITFVSLLIMFFGSFTILGIGLLGEYIGKIFEETKARPAFIRRSLIVHGDVRAAQEAARGRP